MKFKTNGKFLKLEQFKITKDGPRQGQNFYKLRFLIDFDCYDFILFSDNSAVSSLNKLITGKDYDLELNVKQFNNSYNLNLERILV